MTTPADFLPKIKQAAKILRASSVINRNRVLANLQHKILSNESKILEANTKDLEAIKADAAAAFKDRLTLNSKRLSAICDSLSKVESLPDPLNEVTEERSLANGLKIKRVRSPLGVIFMIFESRPNVAVEAFSLAIKSGNAIILRGGKESKNTVEVFYSLMKESLLEAGLPADSLVGITNEDRTIVTNLLQQKKYIDVVVPRGGETLIEFVVEHSKIPIIKNDRGMCHIYVHSDATEQMAIQIIQNAKTQRPGVCNAMETLLIHQSKAKELLPKIYVALNTGKNEVEWHCCDASFLILQNNKNIFRANDKSFDTEYLDYKINCKVVNDLSEAIAHIEQHGSKHSEAIITADEDTAKTFQQEVDAAVVYWNASTRFTDGFELGLGGELGISTQKLHVRGPVGLKELTSVRWIMDGTGQVRA